jgi:hypothetical protein
MNRSSWCLVLGRRRLLLRPACSGGEGHVNAASLVGLTNVCAQVRSMHAMQCMGGSCKAFAEVMAPRRARSSSNIMSALIEATDLVRLLISSKLTAGVPSLETP